ncbi:hypothetical protein [Streptomyces sp. NPDC059814]|uniref:hypothetical protein n=1 Tax=Streptomyces sp. NPDC059814 TaxID=3346959 RepID=UPI00365ED823
MIFTDRFEWGSHRPNLDSDAGQVRHAMAKHQETPFTCDFPCQWRIIGPQDGDVTLHQTDESRRRP